MRISVKLPVVLDKIKSRRILIIFLRIGKVNAITTHVHTHFRIMKILQNAFPGGLYQGVRIVKLYDDYPFEHDFFLQIARSSPFLENLTMSNEKGQACKLNDQSDVPLIEYPHLKQLCFIDVHEDYIEQFLLNSKTVLPRKISLSVDYDFLERVTHRFRRKETRFNCTKIKRVSLRVNFAIPKRVKNYFPNALM